MRELQTMILFYCIRYSHRIVFQHQSSIAQSYLTCPTVPPPPAPLPFPCHIKMNVLLRPPCGATLKWHHWCQMEVERSNLTVRRWTKFTFVNWQHSTSNIFIRHAWQKVLYAHAWILSRPLKWCDIQRFAAQVTVWMVKLSV